MDQRELSQSQDLEEAVRAAFSGLMSNVWTAMPVQVYEDTEDGHTAKFQVTVKRAVQNLSTGAVTYEDHPVSVDVPVHHPQGGQVASTYPTKRGDEGVGVFASRNIDGWHQNGGTQPPVDNRTHSVGDMMHVRGHRSDPNKLQQVDRDSVQHRSLDKKHVHEVHPETGVKSKAADPSTPPASQDFDPFTQASKFYEHVTHPSDGVVGRATDSDSTHSHGVVHGTGPFMRALSGLHSVLCDPDNGSSLNAAMGLHQVLAHPSVGAALLGNGGASKVLAAAGGVSLVSDEAISFSCPPSGFSMPPGAAAASVGQLSGDLSGTLPSAQVVSLANVDTSTLVVAPGDAAAAAAQVPPRGLYLNTSVVQGLMVLCARMS